MRLFILFILFSVNVYLFYSRNIYVCDYEIELFFRNEKDYEFLNVLGLRILGKGLRVYSDLINFFISFVDG